MKAITLTQPWATLVAIGAKKIETRSWGTRYRGPLAIHAAKGTGDRQHSLELAQLCFNEPFRSCLHNAGYGGLFTLPRGAIIAVCELKTVLDISGALTHYFVPIDGVGNVDIPPGEPEASFGDYSENRFAWILTDVHALPEPITVKGALGIWEYGGEL